MKKTEYIQDTPKIVIVGHVDHGKSSLIGRLMYELGQVPKIKYDELKKVSEKRGMEFEFAFLLGIYIISSYFQTYTNKSKRNKISFLR